MPIEPVWSFYPKYFAETARKLAGWGYFYLRLRRAYVKIKYDPKRYEYTDLAIAPVTEDEVATHDMFKTDAAQAYVAQERRLDEIKRGAGHAAPVVPVAPVAAEPEPVRIEAAE